MSPIILARGDSLRARCATARSSRAIGRAGHETLRTRDLEVVGWLAEQYAARVDQLEILLGCAPRTVQRTLARLRDARLILTRRVLVGEPAWVIPTSAGLRVNEHRFALWTPRIGLLAHVAAVNDVRLHIGQRSPSSEWVCERLLARERQHGEHLPDALVLTEGRRVAIEVELTVKSQRRITAILDELVGRFDAVLYYCAPAPHRQLSKLADSGRWPTLGVRELPSREERLA
jgi:hypothetical protein